MQKIKPFLWFNDNAEEAVNFYTSLFRDSKVTSASRYQEGGPGPVGQIMVMSFELFGQEFMALNGGPVYSFSPATSFLVTCETQEEIDTYWDRLLEGGSSHQCGWLDDRFGVTWQIVPSILGDLLQDPDVEKSQRVMHAMLQMVKLDIATLQRAAEGA